MIITEFKADGFKNLNNINITLNKKMNVFCGENAQGKTNIIEAIWLLSGVKSFRGTKDKDLICLDRNSMETSINFENSFRNQSASLKMIKNQGIEKLILLNGVKQKTISNLFGNLKCVIFTPEDLELTKGSPENRRMFIDLCISQIKPQYKSVINKYETLISQRNILLKNIQNKKAVISDLDIWDEQLAYFGSYISVLRYTYTKKLNAFAKKMYCDISSEKENLDVLYQSTVFENLEGQKDYKGKMKDIYLKKLVSSRNDDIKCGFTSVGIHRDDIFTYINKLYSRDFASQGQQRSIALVLKLSEAYILNDETDDFPVVMLDDVLSELDKNRQDFVLNSIKDMQVIITCCNSEKIRNTEGKTFIVKNGQVV